LHQSRSSIGDDKRRLIPLAIVIPISQSDTMRTDVRLRLTGFGMEIPPHDELTPQGLGAFQKQEIEKWWPIIRSAGFKIDR